MEKLEKLVKVDKGGNGDKINEIKNLEYAQYQTPHHVQQQNLQIKLLQQTTTHNNIFCINCGKQGHFFKVCKDPVCSYGLICFYKKKTMVRELPTVNNLFNRKTKKTEHSLRYNKYNKYNPNSNNIGNNISKIKILKRHETISHTLKNMMGIVGANNDELDSIDGIIETDVPNEVEEIIDMDNEYDAVGNIVGSGGGLSGGGLSGSGGSGLSGGGSGLSSSVSSSGSGGNDATMKEVMIDKVLLVQRRNTIGMIEFIRGKYDASNLEYIVKLFNMMTFDEKRLLRQYDSFDMIRTLIGLKREYNYRNEYDESKKKFNMLKNHQLGDQVNLLLDKSYTKWTSPEWGVPKGRRNNKELDIECAIREFVEETGIQYKNINVYRNIKPVEEIYTGINGVVYKHIYFIADIKSTTDAIENMLQVEKGGHLNHEIGNIKLFNLTEAHKLIRPYYMSKLNAIKKGFEIIRDINSYFE